MDKLKLIGYNLGCVFNSRARHACICRALACIAEWPNLKLKTRPKQLLGYLLLAFALPVLVYGYGWVHNRARLTETFFRMASFHLYQTFYCLSSPFQSAGWLIWCPSHKHFTCVTYSCSEISLRILKTLHSEVSAMDDMQLILLRL